MSTPQFGRPDPRLRYPDRSAAFAIVPRAGQIAVVRVTYRNGGHRLDLPGGGVDPGETPAQAAVRECGEEAGLRVAVGPCLVTADHYFVNEDEHANNTRGQFFVAESVVDAPELQVEPDHALIWMSPHDALLQLDRESHVWAVIAWLREDARTVGIAPSRLNG